MNIRWLDRKENLSMFVQSMFNRFEYFLASTMPPEEKLSFIIANLEKEVQEKRVLAREIGAQMRAIADADAANLEPLEALRARRVKLIALGAKTLAEDNKTQLGQIQQEIKSLDLQINSQQSTHDTLTESYVLIKNAYQTTLNSLETIKRNGPAMIKAIEAQETALKLRDKAAKNDITDTSFLKDLANELDLCRAELRSDESIEKDLDATSPFNIDAELAKMDAEKLDADLMAEFEATVKK